MLYRDIYDYLRKRIFSGDFGPGDMLPSENTLCARFGASRETVRKGLKALENDGIIYSVEKKGYFVAAPNHSDFTLTFTEEHEGYRTRFYEIHGMRPDGIIQEKLDIGPKRMVIEFIQITCSDEKGIVACDMKYIPYEKSVPVVESEMRFTLMNPDLTFVPSFNYYTVIDVSPAAADERIGSILSCPAGTPLLLTEKLYIRQDGEKIGYSRQYSTKDFGRLHGICGAVKD